ncbi:MAG TPA: Do family serine endopeptidase [Aestuariivirga sp.]
MSASFTLTRKTLFGLLAAGLLSATALTTSLIVAPPLEVRAESQAAIDPTKGFADLVDRVMPAVISVEVKYANVADTEGEAAPRQQQFEDFFNQFPQFRGQLPPGMENHRPRGGGAALGSGFLISADGYAVTNNHVVQDADEVSVKVQGGAEFKAEVIGTDPKTDLALIKIKSDKPFPFVKFAETPARVGDIVMAVGNPFGLGGTVTTGIISARGRDIGSGPYDDFLQIDASINRGNSGGPAFNLQGEVIGVNTAIFSPSGGSVGIGFAIPAEITQDVVDSLKNSGSVTRGWLGVQIQPVTEEIAESLGLADAKGAIVSDVTEGSPALAAGFKPGDTILKADSQDISDARDLAKKVARIAPGKSINVDIIRDGKPMTVAVKIGIMPSDMRVASRSGKTDSTNLTSLGLKLGPAEDGAGVQIMEVTPNSVADQRGLKPGDVILEIGGDEVNGPADVKQALKETGKSQVLMLVRSGDNQRFLALPLAKG